VVRFSPAGVAQLQSRQERQVLIEQEA